MKTLKFNLMQCWLFFSCIVLISSCTPTDLEETVNENPLFTDGASITALIDEETFEANGGNLNDLVTAVLTDESSLGVQGLVITGTENIVVTGSPRRTILLTLYSFDFSAVSLNTAHVLPFDSPNYELFGEAAYSIAYETDADPEIVATTNDLGTPAFTVTFTQLDFEQRIISGTFSFAAGDSEADVTVGITQGEFNNVPF